MIVKYSYIYNIIIFCLITIVMINVSIIPIFYNTLSAPLQLGFYITLLVILLISLKNIWVEYIPLLLTIIIFTSIALSDASPRYHAISRFFTWILLVATVGPLFYNKKLIQLRYKLFNALMIILMVMGGLSFLYWFAGIPSVGRGHFSGLFNHSMLLAPVASIGGLYAFFRFTNAKTLKAKYAFIILAFFNIASVILASSRTSIVGFMFGLLVLLFFYKFKYRRIILTIGLISTTFVFFTMKTDVIHIIEKNQLTSEMASRGSTNTRAVLWKDRLNEFEANPIFGVGFASQDDKHNIRKNRSPNGVIEPGSTYLMVLSMTGISGASIMILLFAKIFLNGNFWRFTIKKEKYKLALYAFFFIHFIAEGYIFSSGAFLAFVFWALVGATYPYKGINPINSKTKYNNLQEMVII